MIASGRSAAPSRSGSGPRPASGLLWTIAGLAGAGLLAIAVDLLNDAAMPLHGALTGIMATIACAAGVAGWRLWRAAPMVQPDIDGLLRRKDAAEAANAAKSRFLASVSHEIRSPLNAICGYAQLLERGGERDPAEAARVIRRSAEHLAHLAEGLLDMSQVEHGVMKLCVEPTPLAPFLDQVAAMFRNDAAARGLTFLYERPPALPDRVRMDPGRLRQILINLLSNAIKFTAAGTIGFRVRYAGQIATFEISDTGPGIAPDRHEAIFEPFERGEPAAGAPPGAGLGLAITQALVRMLGGNLAMESRPGAGTTFRVTMMLGAVAGPAGTALPNAPIGGYAGPRRSILVADDDRNHLSLMRAFLESLGFAVTVASRGDVAAEIGRDQRFDLALLDLSMPGLDGLAVAERLRAGDDPPPRIIILSGEPPGKAISEDWLVKPVDLDRLAATIGTLLGLRWHPAPAASPPAAAILSGEPLPALPEATRAHLDRIRDLVRIGHARGIEGEIKALEAAAPEATALTARLYGLLDRFDFAGLAAAVAPRS